MIDRYCAHIQKHQRSHCALRKEIYYKTRRAEWGVKPRLVLLLRQQSKPVSHRAAQRRLKTRKWLIGFHVISVFRGHQIKFPDDQE